MSLTKRILSCMLLLLLLALVLLNAWHGEQEKRQEKTDFSAVFCEGKEIQETLADAEQVLLFAPEDDLNNVERDKLIFHTYSRATINTTLRKLAKRVGIEKRISFHSARRTFATLAKMQGVSDFALKNYMGHSNYRMTERYTKWSPNLAESSAREYRLFEIKKLLKNDS